MIKYIPIKNMTRLEGTSNMKLIANRHEPKDIFKKVREWTKLTQKQLGEQNGKIGRAWVKNIENGKNRFYFEDFLKICKKNGITITLEKK